MIEYIGVVDEIGEGLANMYITDEPIVRCRDCEYERMDARYCAINGFDESDLVAVDPDGFCKWGKRYDR